MVPWYWLWVELILGCRRLLEQDHLDDIAQKKYELTSGAPNSVRDSFVDEPCLSGRSLEVLSDTRSLEAEGAASALECPCRYAPEPPAIMHVPAPCLLRFWSGPPTERAMFLSFSICLQGTREWTGGSKQHPGSGMPRFLQLEPPRRTAGCLQRRRATQRRKPRKRKRKRRGRWTPWTSSSSRSFSTTERLGPSLAPLSSSRFTANLVQLSLEI